MRTSSNPAFRNLPTTGGYAGFGSAPAGLAEPAYSGAPAVAQRAMTVDDVVTKTSITLAVLVAAGALTWLSGLVWLALPAALIGFVLAMVVIFKKTVSPPLILTYAAAQGVFLGGISAFFNARFGNGIVLNAVAGTALVFAGMLVVYKSGVVRVTPQFQKWMIGALIGVVGLMLVNLIASFFIDGGLGLRDGGPLAIIFSLVCIGVAAFSFLLDFNAAEQAIRSGAPEKFAWYIAFGLTVTLVWLYLEMLRLLSYFQGE
ncbi:MAG: Bax inhibitor-1/YccA family protein [Actinomycetota bacterium]|nr:Bax inhibitor-1/YccA family protein [Actinomycetota bacterium]